MATSLSLLSRSDTLAAAEPEAAAPRRLQKPTPPGVSRITAGQQTLNVCSYSSSVAPS
jgi:hypothetical protein